MFDEDVWRYELAVFSNPSIKSQGPENPDAFYEGQTTSIRLLFTTRQPPKPWVFRPPWTVMAMLRFSHNPGRHRPEPQRCAHLRLERASRNHRLVGGDKTVRCDATLSYNLSSEGEEFAADDTSAGVGLRGNGLLLVAQPFRCVCGVRGCRSPFVHLRSIGQPIRKMATCGVHRRRGGVRICLPLLQGPVLRPGRPGAVCALDLAHDGRAATNSG